MSLHSGLRRRLATDRSKNTGPKNSRREIRILQLNSRGLLRSGKRAEIALAASRHNADILCIQETHLKPTDQTPRIEGYDAVGRCDRSPTYTTAGGRGGGVLTYQLPTGDAHMIDNKCLQQGIEAVIIGLRTSQGLLRLANIYVPPQLSTTEWYTKVESNCMIVADCNTCGSWYVDRTTPSGIELETFLESTDRYILNAADVPTRTDPRNGVQSGIDITAVPSKWLPYLTWEASPEPLSDHHVCTTVLQVGREINRRSGKRSWSIDKADWITFTDTIQTELQNIIHEGHQSIDKEYGRLCSAIMNAAHKAIPRGNKRRVTPWWCDEASEAVRSRSEAWKAWKADPTEENKQSLDKVRSETARTIDKIKQATWRNLMGRLTPNSDDGQLWKITKSIDQRSKAPTSCCPPGGEEWKDSKRALWFLKQQIRKSKARRFSTDKRNEYRRYLDEYHSKNNQEPNQTFSEQHLTQALSQMSPRKAPGPDHVQVAFLQHLPDVAKELLLALINRSFRDAAVPAKWRSSILIPIPKPGVSQSFRPISLTSVIARTAERMIYNLLMQWLEPKLQACQAGFRMNRSTEEQVEALCESITAGWNNKNQTLAMFCDFSAAYDRVPHHDLMVKLGKMGCPTKLWCWIRSFIMDRRWKCRSQSKLSSERIVPQGLPQRGSLSPPLSIAYISDLDVEVKAADNEVMLSIFADDTAMWVTAPTLQKCREKMQNAVQRLEQYCRTHVIKLNGAKSVLVPFTYQHWQKRKSGLTIEVAGQRLMPSNSARFLGILLDSHLHFNKHLHNIRNRYLARCRILRRLTGTTWGASWNTTQTLRQGFVEPIALYGASITIPNASEADIRRLEQARNEALRIQTGCVKSTPMQKLRELVRAHSLTDIATGLAATLYEKAKRLPNTAPIQCSLSLLARTKIRKARSTVKKRAEEKRAQLGILQLPRAPLPAETGLAIIKNARFFYTKCSKTDSQAVQQEAAQLLLKELPPVLCEVWTDGSVGKPRVVKTSTKRIAVEWDEGWYAGTLRKLGSTMIAHPKAKSFSEKRNRSPDAIVYYDDEFLIGYEIRSTDNLVDEDGHELRYYSLDIEEVGIGAYCIYWNNDSAPQQGTVPAGIGVCSFTAETAAVYKAIEVVQEKQLQGWRGAVRIVTDSRSLVDCIQSPMRKQPSCIQQLCTLLHTVMKRSFIQAAWVPAHCGLHRNEVVDTLAKKGLTENIEEQMRVPLFFEDVKARIKEGKKCRESTISEEDALEEGIPVRQAETTLAQIFVGHTAKLHPVSTYLNKKVCRCQCIPGKSTIKNDVNHFILRCPKRRASRRLCLPRPKERQAMTVSDMVLKWPRQLLVYLKREEFFS